MDSDFSDLDPIVEDLHYQKYLDTFRKQLHAFPYTFDHFYWIKIEIYSSNPIALKALHEVNKEYKLIKLISQ